MYKKTCNWRVNLTEGKEMTLLIEGILGRLPLFSKILILGSSYSDIHRGEMYMTRLLINLCHVSNTFTNSKSLNCLK